MRREIAISAETLAVEMRFLPAPRQPLQQHRRAALRALLLQPVLPRHEHGVAQRLGLALEAIRPLLVVEDAAAVQEEQRQTRGAQRAVGFSKVLGQIEGERLRAVG